MKIATYNVNSINARLPVLLHWLASSKPDVACLQELKTTDEKFPVDAIREAGYEAVWHGQKAWNGVAVLARGETPQETRRGLPGDPDDTHSRYIEAVVCGVTVGCLYLPERWVDDALFRPESREAYRRAARPGVDGRVADPASGRDDLHLLGLHAG